MIIHAVLIKRCSVAVMTDDTGVERLMSRCPFVQNTMCSESSLEDVVDLALTAEAVLQGRLLYFGFYQSVSAA